MPCKKIQQPPSICPPSSRRILETLAIRDLPTGLVCVPNLDQDGEAGPTDCGPCACDEDDCAPGTCAMNRQCETSAHPAQGQVIETCLPTCKSMEVEAMIGEMKSCQEIIRSLALEAMEILHSDHNCPICKQGAQAQIEPQAIAYGEQQGPFPIDKGPLCDHCKDSNLFQPANQKYQGSDGQSRTKLLHSEPDCPVCKQVAQAQKGPQANYQGTDGQSRTKFLAAPSTPLQSRAHSRTSSVPIAQTAFQIKEGRLPKTEDSEEKLKKISKKESDIEESLKKKNKSDSDIAQKNTESYNQPYLEESKSCLQKIFGRKPSICSCDGVRNLNVNCACKGKVDCRCGGSKSYFQRLFGKKPSVCSCYEDPTMQNENEGRFSSPCIKKLLRRKNDCYCPLRTVDKEKEEQQNKDSQAAKRKSNVDVGLPKCDKNICQCHYPPSYNQYFTCTGQVTGNCSCDKNV